LHLSIFYEYQQFFQHRICFSIQPQLQHILWVSTVFSTPYLFLDTAARLQLPVTQISTFHQFFFLNIGHPIRTLIILVQDKNTSLILPVGVSPLQLVNLHRNRIYVVIKLHTWFCLSYFLKTNIKCYCIYQYFMSINSFFKTVSVSRYSGNFNS
jgi:hypothetical protein